MNFTLILHKISQNEHLDENEASFAMNQILRGELHGSEIAAFLMGMRTKNETIEELTAFVKVMRNHAVKVDVNSDGAVDLCGTGGDASGTFNISTAAMFVVAGADIKVLKHGNRSVSSKCGSSDVLEALGVNPYLHKEQVEQCFNETGLAFMFAPYFHPALKYVMPVRRALKMRTFFNILGPLLNPADVKHQIIGAYNRDTAEIMARILANLETERAYTLNSLDGLDEFSISSETDVFELRHKMVSEARRFRPTDVGFKRQDMADLIGGNKETNAEIIKNILTNKAKPAQRNIVLLNAMFAIHVTETDLSFADAKEWAEESLNSGKALQALTVMIEATQDLK